MHNSPSASVLSLYSWFPMSHEVKKLLLSRSFPPIPISFVHVPPSRRRIAHSERGGEKANQEGERAGRAAMIRFLLIDPEDGKGYVVFWGT